MIKEDSSQGILEEEAQRRKKKIKKDERQERLEYFTSLFIKSFRRYGDLGMFFKEFRQPKPYIQQKYVGSPSPTKPSHSPPSYLILAKDLSINIRDEAYKAEKSPLNQFTSLASAVDKIFAQSSLGQTVILLDPTNTKLVKLVP